MNILDLITDVDENVLVEEGDGLYSEVPPKSGGGVWAGGRSYATFQQAVNSVQAGQTIHIKAGTYPMMTRRAGLTQLKQWLQTGRLYAGQI